MEVVLLKAMFDSSCVLGLIFFELILMDDIDIVLEEASLDVE